MVHLRVNSMNPKGAAYFREAGFRNVEVKGRSGDGSDGEDFGLRLDEE